MILWSPPFSEIIVWNIDQEKKKLRTTLGIKPPTTEVLTYTAQKQQMPLFSKWGMHEI